LSLKEVFGLTISGGEPTEQIAALNTLLEVVREKTNLSILMFSGRTIEEITELPQGRKLINYLDVLIAGRFDKKQINNDGIFPSSKNQKIHFLSALYSEEDFKNIPLYEIIISENGGIVGSGIKTVDIL